MKKPDWKPQNPWFYGAFPVCRNYTVRAHLRQHAAVGGLRPEGRAGVARSLGHQDDREHLRPSGHTPQAFHCQRLGTSAAAFEAVKTKKRQILSDLTLLLTLTATFGQSVIIGFQKTQIYQRFAGSRQEVFILKLYWVKVCQLTVHFRYIPFSILYAENYNQRLYNTPFHELA